MQATAIQDYFQQIADLNQTLVENSRRLNLGDNSVIVRLHGKFIWEEQGWIYRIDDPYAVKKRIALLTFAQQERLPGFLAPEEIVKTNNLFCMTKQAKLRKWNPPSPLEIDKFDCYGPDYIGAQIWQDYPADAERIRKFFQHYGLGWVHSNNAGIGVDGKVKIFDYIDNFAITNSGKVITQGGKGC